VLPVIRPALISAFAVTFSVSLGSSGVLLVLFIRRFTLLPLEINTQHIAPPTDHGIAAAMSLTLLVAAFGTEYGVAPPGTADGRYQCLAKPASTSACRDHHLDGGNPLPLFVVVLGSCVNASFLGLSTDLWSGGRHDIFDFSAFGYIFKNYGDWALFSLELALGRVAICLLVAVSAGYALVRHPFLGSGLVEELVQLPLSLPGITLSMGLLAVYGELRGPLLVLAGHLLYTIPFMLRVVTATLRSFEVARLETAARSLGASLPHRLFLVILPNLRHATMVGSLLVFA
jgi:ABC-type spermidine/putrescine transport system permease subunit II